VSGLGWSTLREGEVVAYVFHECDVVADTTTKENRTMFSMLRSTKYNYYKERFGNVRMYVEERASAEEVDSVKSARIHG
jgi:hypothetical protein